MSIVNNYFTWYDLRMKDYNKQAGEWLGQQRYKVGMTQKQVGIGIGKGPQSAQQFVSMMESSQRPITVTKFFNYCRVLGISPEEISAFYASLK